jgi:integrase
MPESVRDRLNCRYEMIFLLVKSRHYWFDRPPFVQGDHHPGRARPGGHPRELRHSFVSIMSDNGVPLETIADLVGHASTAVTEEVYRHQLRPVITKGAETMNIVFSQHRRAMPA